MSRNTRNLLFILGVAAALCIIAGVAAFLGARTFASRSIATDPAKVQAMANEFVNYKLPSGYVEQVGMDFSIYKMILIGAANGDTSSKPMIFLAHFDSQNLTPEDMAQQMQSSVEQQSGSSGLSLKVVETRTITINGHDAPLTVSEGNDSTGIPYRQWTTFFPGKTGMVIVLIQGKVSVWDDAVLEAFLASIST